MNLNKSKHHFQYGESTYFALLVLAMALSSVLLPNPMPRCHCCNQAFEPLLNGNSGGEPLPLVELPKYGFNFAFYFL
jgi:hypothetical protein